MHNRQSPISTMQIRRSSFILHPSSFPRGFTLVELLIVVGIIAILAGILIPVIGRVNRAAYATKSQQVLSSLSTAIESYYQDYRAYPGPLANNQIGVVASSLAVTDRIYPASGAVAIDNITMAENLVLGLCGGLGVDNSGSAPFPIRYIFNEVGQGSRVLAMTGVKMNQRNRSYVTGLQLSSEMPRPGHSPSLTPGHFGDEAAVANDTSIPEFIDAFPSGLPILYLRARQGGTSTLALGSQTNANNAIITVGGLANGQYQLEQIIGYTAASTDAATNGFYIGEGRDQDLKDKYVGGSTWPQHGLAAIGVAETVLTTPPSGSGLNYRFPFSAYPALGNPSFFVNTGSPAPYQFSQPRQKDGYILISAGPDRIYGTDDDITNFGSYR